MNCELAREYLGPLLDGDLPGGERSRVEAHVAECASCRAEYEALCVLASQLTAGPSVSPPDGLWAAIEQRLDADHHVTSTLASPAWLRLVWRPSLAAAALIALAVGLGMLAKFSFDSRAEASTVDFGALLDALPSNAEKAFADFLALYGARKISPVEVKRQVRDLNFDLPDLLPGGFHLRDVYLLSVGNHPGVAATYDRDGEFLGAVFHREVKSEGFGTHKDYPFGTGQRRGHKVKVGEWKLVHLTDRTRCHCAGACHCVLTCQCVLSKLNEETELPPVLAAIAADSPATGYDNHHP